MPVAPSTLHTGNRPPPPPTHTHTGQSLSLSEQQLVDCAWDYGNDGCMGGYIEPTLAYVIDGGGIAQEADYPYLAQNSWCRGPTPTPDANWTTAAATAATAATKSAASFSAKIGGKSKGGNKAAAPLVARFSDFVNVPPRGERLELGGWG